MNIRYFFAEVRADTDHSDGEYENVPHGMTPPQDVPNAICERELENNVDTEQSPVPEYVNVSNNSAPHNALDKPPSMGQHQYEDLGPRPYVPPSEYDRIQ